MTGMVSGGLVERDGRIHPGKFGGGLHPGELGVKWSLMEAL